MWLNLNWQVFYKHGNSVFKNYHKTVLDKKKVCSELVLIKMYLTQIDEIVILNVECGYHVSKHSINVDLRGRALFNEVWEF